MPVISQPAAVDRWVDEFLAYLELERGLAVNTIDAYRRDLRTYLHFCRSAGIDPAAARTDDLTLYLEALRTGAAPFEEAYSASSVARMLVAVKAFYKFQAREGRLERDPTAKLGSPRRPRSLPKALSLDDVQRLLDQPDDSLLGRRDRAILETLYATGMRISELVALDVDDVDLDHGFMTVRSGKGSKGRRVLLGRFAREAVGAYESLSRPELVGRSKGGSARGALFLNARGGRLTRQGCWKILKSHAERAGLGEAVSPHTLRHSCATHMLEGGADIRDVQELLGHASPSTTQVYTLVTEGHLREVYLTAHPRARA